MFLRNDQDLFRNRTLVEGFIALFASIIDKRITTQQAADQLRHLTRGYAASTDQPLCYLMPEVLTAFPDARFILTIRDSQQSWWDSYYEVFNVQLRTDWYRRFYRFLIFWIGFQRRMDDEVQLFQQRCANNFGAFDAELYTKHNDAVKAAVPKDQLLVYNVKQGWEPLCKHLGVAVPAAPFPNLNDRKTMQRIMLGVQVFGACTWVFYAGLAGIAVYLAAKPATNLEVMPYVD